MTPRAVAVPVALAVVGCTAVLGIDAKELVPASDASTDAIADVENLPPEPADCRDVDPRYQTARWPAPPDALSGTDFVIDEAAGTVLDSKTGLMWQRMTAGEATFDEAKCACTALVLGGYPDWRLPSYVEMATIVDYVKNVEPEGNGVYVPATNLAVFPDMDLAGYWTTTSVASNGGINMIQFFDGHGNMQSGPEGNAAYRCVRTARKLVEPVSRFTSEDGIVTDHVTALEWEASASPEGTYDQASGRCKALLLGGRGGFRLPTLKELVTLLDFSREEPPYIDPIAFPSLPALLRASTRYGPDPKESVWEIATDSANIRTWFVTDARSTLCVRAP